MAGFEDGRLRIPAPTIYAVATSLGVAISALFEGFDAEETGSAADSLTLH